MTKRHHRDRQASQRSLTPIPTPEDLAVFFTQDKLDKDGYPVRDRDSSCSP